ncbi:unnamed protein product [Albugo candida]|uniref:Mitochondrial distribution and morphology protein 35 n=1 Tax=Albugo candida TaxID=65357 RepID=A0A024GP37_9STRA|nr:unnamed protein product [Albugo candida]|eukprot:CCI48300.1 unnamed protein product [Albugo candida]
MDPNESLRSSKAKYDQCFDQWYKEVFLQQRANGKLGCENEYKAYSNCLMSEMEHDKTLLNNVTSIMQADVRARWEHKSKKV